MIKYKDKILKEAERFTGIDSEIIIGKYTEEWCADNTRRGLHRVETRIRSDRWKHRAKHRPRPFDS